jgi:hypothetical protein
MKSNKRPPIPWREIRALVRYLKTNRPQPDHIELAMSLVSEWLDPGKEALERDQIVMPWR